MEPKLSFHAELCLPGTIQNEPFADIMQGLACGTAYAQYSFPFHLHFGGGIRYTLFTVNEFAVPDEIYGNIQTGSGFISVGWDKFHNDRFATDVSVKFGYAENFILTDVNEANGIYPLRVSSTMIEPSLGLILAVDEFNSYRLHVGYTIYGYGFKPYMIGMQSNEGYDPSGFSKLTQFLLIGFGYTYYFNEDKRNN
jgi:hypothetical protein